MNIEKVNYNKLSSDYNLRYSKSPLSGILDELNGIIYTNHFESILEAGCGTGYWLNGIKTGSVKVFGADLAPGMLCEAKKSNNEVNLVCGDANLLPFRTKQFDLIFCVNALHQFKNKKEFIYGAAGLLKSNGMLTLIGLDPASEDYKWYIYDYFDGLHENDLKRFPPYAKIEEWMRGSGLRVVERKIVEIVNGDRIGDDVFNDSFLIKNQSSQLASLRDQEYSAGIERIRKVIENNPDTVFPVRMNFEAISAVKI